MPVYNNIFNIKVNSVASNGSVNFGNAFHNSHTAHTKAQGTNTAVGDFAPASSLASNRSIDPDFSDQSDILDPVNASAGSI